MDKLHDYEILLPLTMSESDFDPPEEESVFKKSINEDRIVIDTIRTYLAEGKSDTRIIEELSLNPARYAKLKRRLYQLELESLQAKTPEEHYIDYRLKQERTIQDIEVMSDDFRNSNNHNALIGAIRLKSEIIGKIWQTGREIGIIKPTPDRDREIAGVLVNQLDKEDIREKVITEVKNLYKVVAKFGDRDILEAPKISDASKESIKKIDKVKRKKQ